MPRLPSKFIEFTDESINKNVALKEFDKIYAINDSITVSYRDELVTNLKKFSNQTVVLNIERGTEKLALPVKVNAKGLIKFSNWS